MPRTGNAMQTIASTRTAASAKSPVPTLWENRACCFQPLSQAVPRIRGRVMTMVTRLKTSRGTVTSTHRVTTARAQGLRSRASGSVLRQGIRASRVGLIRWNRSGTPVASARM